MENMESVVATGNHYVGTIRTNKKGLPGKFPNTGSGKKRRGEMKQMRCSAGNGSFAYFTAWQDNKPVHLLSTFPSYLSSCSRVTKNADGTWSPNSQVT
jgi:hypothetical protein